MRFCRLCGYRLGEGVEEYAATRRFDGTVPPAATAHHTNANFHAPGTWGPIASTTGAGLPKEARPTSFLKMGAVCQPARMNWMFWVVLLTVVLTIGGVVARRAANRAGGGRAAIMAPPSFLGVDGFDTAENGGAFIEGIAAPGTPVDRAGLLGGDVILSFDGRAVKDQNAMREILATTPIGKTVEVVFMRDGEMKKTTLTTIAEKDNPGTRALDRRAGGRGRIGVDDLERVPVPNSNIYGVQLGEVETNLPADIAGLKEGDIVIEFNEKPVRTDGDLRLRIYEALPGSTVKAVVMRGGERLEIPLKIGRSKD
ncbi:MAG TPA: PDZ domain-containing protein [Pyrinomonadaceae bacterium]|jgi:membrane-associated protease RseP (regulator of RpoE activity)|nr:PDZ domain-containing protein [Pyrinomonadaceae bacterium]